MKDSRQYFFLLKISFSHYFTMTTCKTLTPIPLLRVFFGGSGRNTLCSAKRKINVATIETKRHLYFCHVCMFLCVTRRRPKLLPVKCFNSSQHSLPTPDLWIFDSTGTFWHTGDFLLYVFSILH